MFDNEIIERAVSLSFGYETHDGQQMAAADPGVYTRSDFSSNARAVVIWGSFAYPGVPANIWVNLRNAPFVDLSLTVDSRDFEWATTVFEGLGRLITARHSAIINFFRNQAVLFVIGIILWSGFALQINQILSSGHLKWPLIPSWFSIFLALVPVRIVSWVYGKITPPFAIVQVPTLVSDIISTAITAAIAGLMGFLIQILARLLHL